MPPPVPRSALRAWFDRARDAKPRSCIGAEFEMLPVDLTLANVKELPFDGPRGVEQILRRLVAAGPWTPVESEGRLIALNHPGGATVTLEPGSQIEMSTPPRPSAKVIEEDLNAFLTQFRELFAGDGIALLASGLNPFSSTAEVQLGPKRRYQIMTRWLSKTGDLALDMMRRTLSVHGSFDFSDEADMVEKTRVAFAAAPIVTAIFANSALEKLQPNGFRSFRGEVWRRTDPARCGLLPEVFEKDFSFEKYLDVVLRTPLIFSYKDGVYRETGGIPAGKWFAGEWSSLTDHDGLAPVADDLEWIINQSFRDARLRRYLECRAADFPSPDMPVAPIALWTGLLYDANARRTAWSLMEGLDIDERRRVAADVARNGLGATAGTRPVLEIARELVAAAHAGLVARGKGEESLLVPVEANLTDGMSPADRLLSLGPDILTGPKLAQLLRLA